MTLSTINKMLTDFNLETLAPYEREQYRINRIKNSKVKSLSMIIENNNYSSEEITNIAEYINEYEIIIK